MRYEKVIPAQFLARPNRFEAQVRVAGRQETVHVKNTGRCRELLRPGAEVYLALADRPGRKTRYDLIAVRKDTGALFNIDSQAPNRVVGEWLEGLGCRGIFPERPFGDSRLDFYLERGEERCFLEVKGCTLEIEGVGYFPDAPTQRGTKHLRELIRARQAGYRAVLAFVIQTEGINQVLPNAATDPEFARTLAQAVRAGVEVLHLPCRVTPDTLTILSGPEIFPPKPLTKC